MIIDISAFTGHWPTLPLAGDVSTVCRSLCEVGVETVCLSHLGAAWCTNPHAYNEALYCTGSSSLNILPVPALDPTIATWEKELETAMLEEVRLVRLLPAYSPYELSEACALLTALAEHNLVAIIQTRIEDPRRQHVLAQVPDLPAAAVAEVARQFPDLTVIIGGPRWSEIQALKEELLELDNLYADVSQADGMNSLAVFVEEGLTPKLLFGSHAPLFVPWSAMARVVADLEDHTAASILGENAQMILGL